MIETIELAAGVTLLAVQTEKFKSGCFSFNLMRPHTKAAAPLDALLPSVLLRGSERWPDMRAISMRLDELYGATLGTLVRLRGETKLTGFYADFIEEAFLPAGEAVFAPMVEFFRDILFHPALENGLLNARYVESEKQNLIHAIESAQNDKRVYAAMRMRRIMCEGEAASIPRLGYAEDVAAITPEALTAHWRTVLRTAPIMLFYAGRRTPQEAAALFRPLFDGLERDPVSPPPTAPKRGDRARGYGVHGCHAGQARHRYAYRHHRLRPGLSRPRAAQLRLRQRRDEQAVRECPRKALTVLLCLIRR